jgi:predicted deacylase
MMMEEPRSVPIDDVDIGSLPRGAKERQRLLVADDLPGPLALPALIVSGRDAGPTLLAVAGVHGNEYEGMEAIRQVFADLDPATMSGAFLGIPVANPLAYAARSRATAAEIDGLNLARVFPGASAGTLTQRLAHHLLRLVERNVGPGDLFVDLHSGSADVAFATLVGFRDVISPGRAASEAAARHFGLPILWRIPESPGPFNAETSRRGVPTIGTETTGRAGYDAVGVAAFADGLRNVLIHRGIIPGTTPARYDGPARPTIDMVAPVGGFFRPAVALYDEVTSGAPLGQIVDLYGDPIEVVKAPVAGTIWACRATPAVRPGELLAMIALPSILPDFV